MEVLKTAPVDVIPVAVHFLLRSAGDQDVTEGAAMVSKILVRLSFLASGEADSEALILKELHHGLLLRPGVATAYLQGLKSGDALGVADVWLLVALRTCPQHAAQGPCWRWHLAAPDAPSRPPARRSATTAFKRLVHKSDVAAELLGKAVTGHRAALEQFFAPLMDLAAGLVRASVLERAADSLRAFGAQMYRLLFEEFEDARSRQEVRACALYAMG
jgi:hypothetical protein